MIFPWPRAGETERGLYMGYARRLLLLVVLEMRLESAAARWRLSNNILLPLAWCLYITISSILTRSWVVKKGHIAVQILESNE
jgi:hypothetical protein